ncbi:hypothetical protein HDU83_003917 [Entophlyctis luteolus]|nr:hypothetical protein HDU83_003917 [Entophlyctis luteolus]
MRSWTSIHRSVVQRPVSDDDDSDSYNEDSLGDDDDSSAPPSGQSDQDSEDVLEEDSHHAGSPHSHQQDVSLDGGDVRAESGESDWTDITDYEFDEILSVYTTVSYKKRMLRKFNVAAFDSALYVRLKPHLEFSDFTVRDELGLHSLPKWLKYSRWTDISNRFLDLSLWCFRVPAHPMFFSGWPRVMEIAPRVGDQRCEQHEKTAQLIFDEFGPFDDSHREKLLEWIINIEVLKSNITVKQQWPSDWMMSISMDSARTVIRNRLSREILDLFAKSDPLEFVKTGAGHPYQWAHSSSSAYHHQCARYMVLGEEELVDFFSLSDLNESTDKSSRKRYLQRPWTCFGRRLLRAGRNLIADCNRVVFANRKPASVCQTPDVFPFTRYLHEKRDEPQEGEAVMSLPAEVVSMDMAYGFLAIGFDDGILSAFCMEDGVPRLILYQSTVHRIDMFNSVHISRRVITKKSKDDDDDDEFECRYEYTLIVTRNSGFIDIHILSEHRDCTAKETPHEELLMSHPRAEIETSDTSPLSPHHGDLLTSAYLTLGGLSSAPNDARISPNGQFLACVGDNGGVWIGDVLYGESDQDAPDFDNSTAPFRTMGELWKITLDRLFASTAITNSENVFETRHPSNVNSLTMQYLSWSCDSRYFAASSDSYPCVLIFDAHFDGQIICKLDAGGPTFAVAFHPTKPRILAFSSRKSAVQIVDLENRMPVERPQKDASLPTISPPRQFLCHQHRMPVVYGPWESTFGSGVTTIPENYTTVFPSINGILWSDDGRYLYVSTDSRVVMHEVADWQPPSLRELSCREIWSGKVPATGTEMDDVARDKARRVLEEKRWAGHWVFEPARGEDAL